MSARRTSAVIAGVLSVGAVAAAVTIFNLPEAESSSSASTTTATSTVDIAKETLIDRESHDGTLTHGDSKTVAAKGSGTLTGMPATGTTVTRGKPVYRLDNKPVTLLYGSLPAYRKLSSGVKGADVKQFEQNLWALGYRGFTVDTTYSSATADAVEDWQDDLGLTETGTVETSQILYATGPVRVDSHTAELGASVQPGTELFKITETTLVAVVDLDMNEQRLAKKGAAVQLTLPDGKVVKGKITDVDTTVVQGEGQDADTTQLEVTIAFTGGTKDMGEATVSAAFTASQRPNVLTVPVAALLALAEGGYGVQLATSTGNKTVAVETGLFADGKVEITGDGLQAGLKVVVPS